LKNRNFITRVPVLIALVIVAGSYLDYHLGQSYATSGGAGNTSQEIPAAATIELKVIDAETGNTLSQAEVGRTVLLSATVANNNITEIQYTSIFEVRDENGVTLYLQWRNGTLPSGDYTTVVDISWVPEEIGSYEVRTFLISGFESPQILSPISGAGISIVEGEDEQDELPYYTNGALMPTPRSEMAAAAIGSKIFVVGGSPGTLNTVEVYNADSDSWLTSEELDDEDLPVDATAVSRLPLAVNHAAAAAHDGLLYVVGGFLENRVPSAKLLIYDASADTWTEGADMLTARAALTANFINGKLYVAGGTNNDASALDVIEEYDPSTDTWKSLPSMPTARQHLTSAVIDGKLYVVGGRNSGPSTNVDALEVYDPINQSWAVLDPMPSPRGGIAASSIGNNLYVFGGESSDTVFDNNEKYDTRTGQWSSEPLLPTARHGLAAVAIEDEIYIIGGGLEPTSSRPATPVVEIYHP
jgi:N-acetylneuraminic acid mutarotase